MGELDAEPLFDLVDLVGRRHALTVLWALRGAPQQFGVLVAATGAPPAVLTQRLRELRESGLLEVDEGGDYRLTTHGRRLQGPLEQLADFATAWARLSTRQRHPRGAADHGAGER